MKKKKSESLKLYNVNPDTNAYIVEVSLDDYSELFNGWDASPLRRRDLEPELMDYLEQASTEIPLSENLELCFYMPKDKRDLEKEFKSITSIMNNFKVLMSVIYKQLSRNYRRLLIYVVVSIIFLSAAYLLRNETDFSLLISIMIEGLFIGGWFLLWEAFSLFFFDTHEITIRKKLFHRLLHSDIYFKDTKE
jgi:RsiW-degrading membrane proteinase PrsW (M82 family)